MNQKIHLSINTGEIIDLYGLSIIEDNYHIFFLYKENNGNKMWGHFDTKDFIEYSFSCGKADIVNYKTGNTHYFANTRGETLMLELIKSPEKAGKTFLSLPRNVFIDDEILYKTPYNMLHELREYKRSVTLYPGESADTFGSVFEAILEFNENSYSIGLRNNISITCEDGNFTITHNNLTQSFETSDFRKVHIFSDSVSLEIFAGGNAVSFPAEYNEKGTFTVLNGQCRAEIYKLKSITISQKK